MAKKKHKKATRRRKRSVGSNVTKSRTHTDYNRNRVSIAVGRINRTKHKSTAAQKRKAYADALCNDIAKLEIKSLKATRQKAWRNFRKKIKIKKQELNRIL